MHFAVEPELAAICIEDDSAIVVQARGTLFKNGRNEDDLQ
jgi:hypothetical protein